MSKSKALTLKSKNIPVLAYLKTAFSWKAQGGGNHHCQYEILPSWTGRLQPSRVNFPSIGQGQSLNARRAYVSHLHFSRGTGMLSKPSYICCESSATEDPSGCTSAELSEV